MSFKIVTPALFLLFSFSCLGQPTNVNLGDVGLNDLEITYCDFDSSASAMVLLDEGKLRFMLDKRTDADFNYLFERHVRIKILSSEGFDNATFEIPIYERGGTREKLIGLKGYTYNLEGSKIVKTKLEKDAIYEEKLTERTTLVKFSFPNIKPGSVIDFKYSINSDYIYTLQDWQFQNEMPVLWSNFVAVIPSFFQYNMAVIGSGRVERTPTTEVVEYFEDTRIVSNRYEWQAYQLPGIPVEDFVYSLNNYRTNLQFELAGYVFGSSSKSFAHNWNEISKGLLDNTDFGIYIKNANFPLAEDVKKSVADLAKAKAIFSEVKNNLVWNGTKTIYASQSPKKVIEDGKGNVADINLMLCGTLRKNGYDALPIVLSTRENGSLITYSYRVTQFNYVVTAVQIDSSWYVLDASQNHIPFNFLPSRCLNKNGLIIEENRSNIIDINTPDVFKINCSQKVSFNESGIASVQQNETMFEHAAYSFRDVYFDDDAESFEASYQKKYAERQNISISTSMADSLDKPVQMAINYQLDQVLTDVGSSQIITLTPLFHISKNPFIEEKRVLPIEFSYVEEFNYLIEIAIPEGYDVVSQPAPARLVTEQNGIKFLYQMSRIGNSLHLSCQLKILRTDYKPEEYPTLRFFFSEYLKKISEPIELVKL